MQYNQSQQGFNQNPGGVPHGNSPTHPNVYVGEVMQQYVPVITAKLYNDMVQRNTAYTQHMAQLYSQNGYNNELLAEAIAIVADYAEYMMVTTNRDFNSIIDGVIQDSNTGVLEHHYRVNPNKIPVPVTQAEVIRQQAIRSKLAGLRPKINEFKAKRENKVNQNFNQNQMGNFPMPSANGNYPQQNNMSPQQLQQHQQALHEQAMYQQALYQQQLYNQQQQQYPNQQAPQQPGSSAFAQRVNQNMARQQQPYPQQFQQNFNQNPQWQQPHPQQFQQPNQQWQQPNQGGMYPGQQQNPFASQQNFQRRNNVGAFATNSNTMQQLQQPQQNGPTKLSASTGYDPMPSIDESQLNNKQPQKAPVDPFEFNAQFIASKQHHAPQQTQSQPQQPRPNGNDNYERNVRLHANKLGLPGNDASLSYLEDAINQVDPSNGIISKKNAYSEINRNAQPVKPTGAYATNNEIDYNAVKVDTRAGSDSDLFATQMRDAMAGESDKMFVKSGNTYITVSKDVQDAFKQEFPDVDINTADMKRYIHERNAPYPFAEKNLNGEWVVHVSDYDKIEHKGWFTHPALYPVISRVGYYVVDSSGAIIDFYSRPKTSKDTEMDFKLHDDSKFFAPMTRLDNKEAADEAQMLKAFANLQVEQKVEEIIHDIESRADVLDVNEKVMVVDKTVVFDEQVNGSLLGDDYYTIGYNMLKRKMDGVEYTPRNLAFRYLHAHLYPWYVKDSDLEIVKGLRYKETYEGILEIMNKLNEQSGFPASWFTRLNDSATRFVNDIVKNRYPLDASELFTISSFCLDIDAAVEEMEILGYGDDFNKTAKQLAQTLLYAWMNTNAVYQNYFGEDEDDDNENNEQGDSKRSYASFGILRDVTIVPLHSRDIPLYSVKNQCLLTEHGFEALWKVARDRMLNKDRNIAEVVLVTTDNRHMYISETATDGIYTITNKSVFE